ncbi:hypothetical protein [Pedobacter sp. BMA]|uniref:hypothetical protein n=1 Tax=Pedobacter sp. BMA TaxID=1663685 RepID=UPI00064A760A|nr:hypothetical protein [Pedobacter sp. BMA]KLT64728.1 hypothetical protein AB669_13335 [Pedobacter sp. BMA]
MNQTNLKLLKERLDGFSAISPASWVAIQASIQTVTLNKKEHLPREVGTLSYLASGFLMEVDGHNRTKVATVLGFMPEQSFMVTRIHNQVNVLVCDEPCTIYEIRRSDLLALEILFPELIVLHDAICAQYDERIAERDLLLNEKDGLTRIRKFKARFSHSLNRMVKTCMANYLLLEYHYFIRNYKHA